MDGAMAARVSLVFFVGLLSACGSGDGESDDADGDGVPASEDCDDGDPSLGARSQDADCDGATYETTATTRLPPRPCAPKTATATMGTPG